MAEIRGDTRVIALFGYPVRHSLSPPMQQAAIDALGRKWVYVPFEVPPDQFERAARALAAFGMVGANCTIPHKDAALRVADEVDPEAEAIGAVNTLTVLEDGRLHGMNTDAFGFVNSLREDGGFEPEGCSAVLIGAGGAGRAMAFGLARAGVARLAVVNRTLEKARRLVEDLKNFGVKCRLTAALPDSEEAEGALGECDLLVNSTSLGLKTGDALPAAPARAPVSAVVYDTVYTPLQTPFLKAAADRGMKTIPGLGMLARQGARSLEQWTGETPNVDLMIEVLKRELKARE